jgi:putative DNA primase/helicase
MPRKPTSKRSSAELSKNIDIRGYGVGEIGERFVVLRIKDGKERHSGLFRIDNLLGSKNELVGKLNRLGAHLVKQAAMTEFLNRLQAEPPRRASFKVATKLGWDGKQFVLPSGVIAVHEEPIKFALDEIENAQRKKYRVSGDLQGWQRLAQLARGNTRLMTALALAFVGPLGDILKVEQVAIQLCGDPGSGKTAVAIAAGSVWGCHTDPNRALNHGFGETWNATLNSLEAVAVAHNHTLLPVDETRAADKKTGSLVQTITDAVMRLEKSVEKSRLNVLGQRSWWVPVLSTSNWSLDEMAAPDRFPIDDAHRGRLIDVPNPILGFGVFEHLHGRANHSILSQDLIKVALAQHGSAAEEYLLRIVDWRQQDEAALKHRLEKWRQSYLQRANEITSASRDLHRFHGKFATI